MGRRGDGEVTRHPDGHRLEEQPFAAGIDVDVIVFSDRAEDETEQLKLP